jgi:putative ABC transport system ATP-binding protein
MLELERVLMRYRAAGEEVRAVDGVSLRVAAGEMVAVQGPSGSGKTTLLLLIAGLLRPDQGAIRFAGRDLSELSDDQISDYLMRDVGFIYQSYRLMPRVSALENAALKLLGGGMGLREAKRQALPWLQRLDLSDRLEHTPEELSGGERQRVAIARALSGDPRLILADEPTGNLDSVRSAETIELLASLAREQGVAVVLVTHDVEAARLADRGFTLRDGRLLEVEQQRASGPQLASGQRPGASPADGLRAAAREVGA